VEFDGRAGGQRRLSMRDAQVGLFAAGPPAGTRGLVWDPEDEIPADAPVAPPAVRCSRQSFDATAVRAFADGRPHDCFGAGWEATCGHLRTPPLAHRPL